jgi:hypothetical protein
MRKVLIDELLLSKLNGLTEVVELCDESGKIVATVVPCSPKYNPEQWDLCEPPPMTPEELERIRDEPEFTTEEVLDYLRKL